MGAVRKLAYGLGRILAKIRASYLQGFYSIHVKIRKIHDKTYAKGGWYKGYSDTKYTSAIHKTVLFGFVFSFAFFTIFQSVVTNFIFPVKPVRAGTNSVTWSNYNDFTSNAVSTGEGTLFDSNTLNISGSGAGDSSLKLAQGNWTWNLLTTNPHNSAYGMSGLVYVPSNDSLYVHANGGFSGTRIKNSKYLLGTNQWQANLDNTAGYFTSSGQMIYNPIDSSLNLARGSNTTGLYYSINNNTWDAARTGYNDNGGVGVDYQTGDLYAINNSAYDFTKFSYPGGAQSNISAAGNDIPKNGRATGVSTEARKIYFASSYAGNNTALFIYDIVSNNITLSATAPVAFNQSTGLTYNQAQKKIYATIGGDIYEYNIADNNWKYDGALPATAVVGNIAYKETSERLYFAPGCNAATCGDIYEGYQSYFSTSTISGLRINAGDKKKNNWSSVDWVANVPAGTSLSVRARTSDDNSTWTAWSGAITSSPSNLSLSSSQYLELEVTLSTTDPSASPTLNEIKVSYDLLETPVNGNIALKKTSSTDLLKKIDGTTGNGLPGLYSSETAVKVETTGLSCAGCVASTNIRPEIEIKPVGVAFDGLTNLYKAEAGNNYVIGTGLSIDTSYHLQVRAIDDQGRVSGWTSYGATPEDVNEADFTIEQTTPTGTVSIGGANVQGTYARLKDVTLNITGTDNGTIKSSPASANLRMRFSNDGTTWSAWENYAATKNWTLAAGADGPRNVYAQFLDNAGNVSNQLTDVSFSPSSPSNHNFTVSSNGSLKLQGLTTVLNAQNQGSVAYNGFDNTTTVDTSKHMASVYYETRYYYFSFTLPQNYSSKTAILKFTNYNVRNISDSYVLAHINNYGTLDVSDYSATSIDTVGTFSNVGARYYDVTSHLAHTVDSVASFQVRANNNYTSLDPAITLELIDNSAYQASGTYTSSVFDNGSQQKFGKINWSEALPGGGTIGVKVRSGDTASPDATWTNWVTVTNNQEINELTDDNVPARKIGEKRYIQYQATLATTDSAKTPVIDDVFIEVGTKTSASITLDTTVPAGVSGLAVYASNQLGTPYVDGQWHNNATPYFNWTANAEGDIAGYKYCFDKNPNCVTNSNLITATNFSPTIADEGKYYFKLVAVDNAGNLSATQATFIYGYDNQVPGRVTSFRATNNLTTSINLSWNPYSDQGSPAENYVIEKIKYNNTCAVTLQAVWDISCAGFETINIANGATGNYTDTLVDLSERYAYRIKAKDFAFSQYGPWSGAIVGQTEIPVYGITIDNSAPTSPSVVTATACDGTLYDPQTKAGNCSNINNKGFEVKITWNPSTDTGSGLDKYLIYRSTTGNGLQESDWHVVGVLPYSNNQTTVWFDNDTNNAATFGVDKPAATAQLNDYTYYYYRVRAFDLAIDGAGNPKPNSSLFFNPQSPNENASSALTPDVTSAQPPTYVTVTALGLDADGRAMSQTQPPGDPTNHQQINITWSAAQDPKARSAEEGSGVTTNYKIYRSDSLNGVYVDITSDASLSCNMATRNCENIHLNDTTFFYYKVKAIDEANNPPSNYSVAGSARTYSSSIPSVPSNINVVSKKNASPGADPEIGHKITLTFNGSVTKDNEIVKYEVYRSTTNYALENEWLLLGTRLSLVGTQCSSGSDKCFNVSEAGTDITISPVKTDTATIYEVSDTGLADATTYYYKVRSQNNTPAPPEDPTQGNFYSGVSAVAPGTLHQGWDITPDATAPAQPQNVKVKDIYGDGLNFLRNIITWERITVPTRGGQNDFKEYRIYRSIDGVTWSQVLNDQGQNPLANSNQEIAMATNYYIDLISVASANQYYYYYVTSVDNAGTDFKYPAPNALIKINEGFSNESKPALDAQNKIISVSLNPAIAQPTIVKNGQTGPALTYVGVSSATIRWYADQLTDSVVEYRPVGSNKWITAGDREVKNAGDSHSVTLVGLSPKTTYEYHLISRNYLGNEDILGDLESEKQYLPVLATKEFLVTNVQKKLTTSTAEVTWETNLDADSAFIEYQLQRQPGDEPQSGTAGVTIESLTTSPQSHKVIIKGLRSARTYSFKVKSISKDGFVAESALDYFRTQSFDSAQFVIAPNSSNLAERNITATSAQIVWSTAIPTTSWVDYGTSSGKYDYSAGDNNLNTNHFVKLENLSSGSTYYYRVRVKDVNEVEYVSQEYSFRAIAKPKISNIRIKEINSYGITIAWETNVPTDTLVNWGTSSRYGERRGKAERVNNHELKIDNLFDDTEYHYQIVSRDEFGNEVVDDDKAVRTPLDTEGPKIVSVKTDVMPLGEGDETAQVIISYETNKPATTLIQYDEGVIGGKYSMSTIKDSTLNMTHTVIIKDLTPATTYHFRIATEDRRKNQTTSNDYTFLTPSKEKSILQLIIKALEETFSWVKNVGSFFQGIGKKASQK
jgi:hypothetical protein